MAPSPEQKWNYLQSQPWMSLQWLFWSIPVIVQELFTGFNGVLGDQNEAGDVVNHDNFGDAVRVDSGVIDQPAKPSALACGVNTNKTLEFKSHLNI